jgi:hypothetical protein
VAAARLRDEVHPLPFVGDPLWSAAAQWALAAAEAVAARVPTMLSTVPLLLGLLSLRDDGAQPAGLTRQVFALGVDDSEAAQARLLAGLPRSEDTRSSRNYRDVLQRALQRARDDGSPLVLEDHLLRALLDLPSPSFDRALVHCGTTRDSLRAAFNALRDGSYSAPSSYSAFSEFPSASRG